MQEIYREIQKDSYLWDLFTKKEEYHPVRLDKHGRFLYRFSMYKDITYPTVSAYISRKGFYVEYPENKKFAINLTHDVDDLYVPCVHLVKSFFSFPKYRDWRELQKLVEGAVSKRKSPYMNLRDIIRMEEEYGAKSSFYFLSTDRDILRYRYNIENLENDIGYIIDVGFEVGLHTGYNSFVDIDSIKAEKERIEKIANRKIVGVRNHFLRFKVPDSWRILSQAGFKYDSSFGYPDAVGFRNGMCHPFKPFDISRNERIEILEIPLHVMDITLFRQVKNVKRRWEVVKKLIDVTERFGGVLTILWHNTSFVLPYLERESTKLYRKILEYGKKKGAWLTNGKEISEYYEKVLC